MGKQTIERSIWIAASRERVWQAVADPAQIAQWFAPGTDFKLDGDKFSILVEGTYMEIAVIEVFDPPRQLTTSNLPDRSVTTTYTLEEENGGTRFTVTEFGYESLSEEERKARLAQDNYGWELVLQNLRAFINGESLPRPEGF